MPVKARYIEAEPLDVLCDLVKPHLEQKAYRDHVLRECESLAERDGTGVGVR